MRTETVAIKIFQFDELTEQAKEKARQWYRDASQQDEWWDFVVEDARTIGALMGWTIDNLYFSGFWSQGDGACFVGRMGYAKGCSKATKAYAPNDAELQRIAAEWQALQARQFYKLSAVVTKTDRRYCHENTVGFDVYRDGEWSSAETESAVIDIGRDFMQWAYSRLEKEYEWLNSDEHVDETICANEYEFDLEGAIV